MKTLKQRKCLKHNNTVLTVFKISFSSPFLYEHIITKNWCELVPRFESLWLVFLRGLWLGCRAWKVREDPYLCLLFWDEGVLWEYPVAKLVLSLSSVISSNKEGKFSSAALVGLVKGIGRKRPSSAVMLLLTAPARIFTCGWITLGALLQRRRFKVFVLNAKSLKMLAWILACLTLQAGRCSSPVVIPGGRRGRRWEDRGLGNVLGSFQ